MVGLTRTDAEAKLTSAGLVVGTVKTVSSTSIPKGNIVGMNPPSGTSVSSGATVNLDESSGQSTASAPSRVTIPDVTGLTRSAAEALLTGAGLQVGRVRTLHSQTVPANGVSDTDPSPGSSVSIGSTVALSISDGPGSGWTQYIPTSLFALLGFSLIWLIGYIVTQKDQQFLKKLAEAEIARGLITFLIAIATVGIAIILAISNLVLAEGDAGDKRFDRGKQVLTTLIGVLGTIVGFYFGSDRGGLDQNLTRQQSQITAPAITTKALPQGAAGVKYESPKIEYAGLVPPLKWAVTPDLPADLKLDTSSGAVGGTPKESMKKTFTFTVTDSATPPASTTAQLDLEIK